MSGHLPQSGRRIEEGESGPGEVGSHGGVRDSPGPVLTEAEHHQLAPLTIGDVGELVLLLRHVEGDVIEEAAAPGHDGLREVEGVEEGLGLEVDQYQFSRTPGSVPGSLLAAVVREPHHALHLHLHTLDVLQAGTVAQSLQLPGREGSGPAVLVFMWVDNYHLYLMGVEKGSEAPEVTRGRTPTFRGWLLPSQ